MNMKKMKRLVALALSVVMVLAMSVMAFAEDGATYSITIKNAAAGHIYEAYQIFTGDLSEKTENGKQVKILSNITWGNGVKDEDKTTLGDAKTKAESLTTEENAKGFAKTIASSLQNPTTSTNSTSGVYTISGLKAGYYLVKDQDNTLTNKDDFYTAYIMEVVGNVEANPKGEKPTLDKQIKHNESNKWGVVGDNQIGDTVEFRTITSVPDTKGYDTYSYII